MGCDILVLPVGRTPGANLPGIQGQILIRMASGINGKIPGRLAGDVRPPVCILDGGGRKRQARGMKATAFDPLPDEQLAARAAREPSAFQALYGRFARRVFGLLATMGLKPDLADDVAQQVWTKVWQGLERKPADSPFCPWLMQIARNAAIDQLRRKKPAGMPEEMQIADEWHGDVLADLEETSDMERLRSCMGKLPEVERTIVRNRLEGIDSPAIAVEVGLPSERVHRLFHEAKQKLQRCLGVDK